MKKFSLLLLSLFLMLAMAACNGSDDNSSKDTAKKNDDTNTTEIGPTEPTSEDKCAFCDMKIYLKNEEMGQFTAQALTEDGKYLFFDDSGCLLNYARKTGTVYEKEWVRDYYTLNWIEKDDALIVHSDLATPMKYGYAFFSSEADVDLFTSDHADLKPAVSSWDDIDTVANERYQMKMQQQQDGNNDAGTSEHSGS